MVDGGFSPSSAFAENVGTDTTDSTISSAKIKEHTCFRSVFIFFLRNLFAAMKNGALTF